LQPNGSDHRRRSKVSRILSISTSTVQTLKLLVY
jgi:hypothetical protein